MTPVAITIKPGWAILDGPNIDGLLSALRDDSTVEFTLLPAEAENLRRKLKLPANVRQIGNLSTSDYDRGRNWRIMVVFIGSRRFTVTNTSPVEIDFYTSDYGDRPGARGGMIWDATPDEEKIWVARADGSIVRGVHFHHREIIGNIRDLPKLKSK